jgi:tetratricopeptide (TPR) repeat protein
VDEVEGQTAVVDEVFVGRSEEMARFVALLGDLTVGGSIRSGRWRHRPPVVKSAGADKSRVVLVHGLGGSGKSRLLRQFREMADGRLPGAPASMGQVSTVWLDWEAEQRDQLASYAAADGPSLPTVLDAVQKAVRDAFAANTKAAGQVWDAFAGYRHGAIRVEYAARFANVSAQSRPPFTSGDAVALGKSLASIGLVGAGHPEGVLGLTGDQLAASAHAVAHLSEAAVQAVTGKKTGEISPEEYDLVTVPARELTRRVAVAIHTVASKTPLVIFLDTGEVLGGRAWGWLRRVVVHTGPRVIWVVGARFKTEAEVGAESPVAQFAHDIGDAHLVLMSLTPFNEQMISDYLDARLGPDREYRRDQVGLIARFTKGHPLAVSITATLLDKGLSAEDVCRDVGDDGRSAKVVSDLADLYLRHAERLQEEGAYPPGDPRRGDLMKICGLALARGDLSRDGELLSALWNLPDKETESAFKDLARRHDFVLAESRQLHDDVRDVLRTALLLKRYRRDDVRQIGQRALSVLTRRLDQHRLRWPDLDEQLSRTEFTSTLLNVLWYSLWTDNQDGLDVLTAMLPVLAVGHHYAAGAAAEMAEQFVKTFKRDELDDLNLITEFRDMTGPSRPGMPAWSARVPRFTLKGLDLYPGQTPDDLLIGKRGDREAAVLILRRRLIIKDRDSPPDEVAVLQAAAGHTTSTWLRQAIGFDAGIIANVLYRSERPPSDTCLAALKLETEMLPGDGPAWGLYGQVLYDRGRHREALDAYDRLIALGSHGASAYIYRGTVLRALGQPEDALAAYDEALRLDPSDAHAHGMRGITLLALGRARDARDAFTEALARETGTR